MKLEQNKKITEKEILKKYCNWVSQTNFLELNTGCGGCGFAIRSLTKILIENRLN